MTYQTPCQQGNPDDWFLSRDGKQDPDDDLIDADLLDMLRESARDAGKTVEEIDAIVDQAEREELRIRLRQRRHAKDACFTCYFRMQCLDIAIQEGHTAGTWGGYFEEELREIRREIERRRKAREAHQ